MDRLTQVLQADFSTIPVVNMHGGLIGLVPKNFIITLIENHCWYEHKTTTGGKAILDRYATHKQREADLENDESINLDTSQNNSFRSNQTIQKYTGDTDQL